MYYCPDQAYKAFIPGIPWETSTWVLFSSSSHFAPQKYFCGIKWDFDNLSWELDAAQIFFLLQLTSLLKMGGDRIMRHSIRGSGSIHKGCSSLAETPNIRNPWKCTLLHLFPRIARMLVFEKNCITQKLR